MRLRAVAPLIGAGLLLAPLVVLWADSLAPKPISAAEMGVVDTGGGVAPPGGQHRHDPVVSVDRLVLPPGPADRRFTLRTRQDGPGRFTVNHRTPGPELRVRQGHVVEVDLVNESVAGGVTLHWHGVDVPNAADGVAGVTQDAVPVGGHHVYRFRADRAGTFWYHSHQLSHRQVLGGLLGALVVQPRAATASGNAASGPDVVALLHLYDGRRTLNGSTTALPITVPARQHLRLRLINTDNGPVAVQVSGATFRVVATDGNDVVGPTDVRDHQVSVTAGGRADLLLSDRPATVAISGVGWVHVNGGAPPGRGSLPELDFLTYGRHVDLSLATQRPDRRFAYTIGRRPGFVDGRPGRWWTVNGTMWPHVPMFMVAEGDVVTMTITNRSGEVHPMHLHGHRVLVLSRNGVASTGSPWWLDSINVLDGETYLIAFRADNPGIWMDHCHNLPHAAQGLVTHLMYEGVDTPYRIDGRNEPE